MAVKTGSPAMALVKGGRGLAYDVAAYESRDQVMIIPAVTITLAGTALTPGQETEVLVPLPGLRPNADVKAIRATLWVLPGQAATQEPSTVRVREGAGAERTFAIAADPRPGLSNVSIRLAPGEVFWSRSGVLEPGDHPIPVDFAAQVNAYLDATAHHEGTVSLRFLIRTDTPGQVLIRFGQLVFTLLQTQTWPNDLDGTLRADRNLTLGHHSEVRLPLSVIAPLDGHPPALARIVMEVSGRFGPERSLEDTGRPAGEFCTLDVDHALARGLVLDPAGLPAGGVRCTGFSIHLRQSGEAELYAELQPDAGQGDLLSAPATGPPLTKANVVLAAPPDGTGQPAERVVSVRFDEPTELRAGLPYWLVIKGVRGAAQAGLRASADVSPGPVLEERLRINRGGRMWKQVRRGGDDRTRARMSLIYVPGPDDGRAALDVAVDTGDPAAGPFRALADPGARPETLAIALGGVTAPDGAVLVVRSNAAGECTIAGVIQEYAPADGAP
ncbi:hypothetical protein [Actinoplanes sp. OR16]|uniref:hypothetical protein n=1 Tax=Actinoplanes sp. OR16 TaxID=946334 RepID=UPI000FD95929|nr:hypothetical protein [Actinoplanes sp. OR16]